MSERRPIRLLGNARQLIDAVAEHGPLTPAEISQRTGIPRPSVYRLADGLAAIGLTTTAPDSRVALTLRWLNLSDDALDGMQEWEGVRLRLTSITRDTDQTAFLSLPRSEDAVCIAWSPGRGIGVLILKPGRSLPLHVGAAGRLALAHSPLAEAYLRRAPFEALTPRTLTTRAALEEDVAQSLDQGFVHSDEDATVGIGALGVPLLDGGHLVGCLSLAGIAQDVRERREDLLGVLHEHVAGWVAESRGT